LLYFAVSSGIPIISIQTDDLLNVESVLYHITGKTPSRWLGPNYQNMTQRLWVGEEEIPPSKVSETYEKLIDSECTLVLINPDQSKAGYKASVDLGPLEVPQAMVVGLLKTAEAADEIIDEVVPVLRSLSLKQCGDVLRYTMARDGALSRRGVSQSKSVLVPPSRGLELVSTELDIYHPSEEIVSIVERDRIFFLEDGVPERLIPRGMLLKGEPGVGKTSAAKYVAAQWGVPCYWLDLGSVKSKYVGESEGYLRFALKRIEVEAPCVLLLDEVEKLFWHTGDDVMGGLVSRLLWWLSEHRSRVYTVMTTNDLLKIPREMYRMGRIDGVVEVVPLYKSEAEKLSFEVLSLHASYLPEGEDLHDLAYVIVHDLFSGLSTASHADVVETTRQAIKALFKP